MSTFVEAVKPPNLFHHASVHPQLQVNSGTVLNKLPCVLLAQAKKCSGLTKQFDVYYQYLIKLAVSEFNQLLYLVCRYSGLLLTRAHVPLEYGQHTPLSTMLSSLIRRECWECHRMKTAELVSF